MLTLTNQLGTISLGFANWVPMAGGTASARRSPSMGPFFFSLAQTISWGELVVLLLLLFFSTLHNSIRADTLACLFSYKKESEKKRRRSPLTTILLPLPLLKLTLFFSSTGLFCMLYLQSLKRGPLFSISLFLFLHSPKKREFFFLLGLFLL